MEIARLQVLILQNVYRRMISSAWVRLNAWWAQEAAWNPTDSFSVLGNVVVMHLENEMFKQLRSTLNV